MLNDILKIISRDSYISKPQIAKELKVEIEMVEQGLSQLLRMGYLAKEETIKDCNAVCAKCPFAKSCNKEVADIYKITDKGNAYLK